MTATKRRLLSLGMRKTASFSSPLAVFLLLFLFAQPRSANCQSLEELKQSEAYRKLGFDGTTRQSVTRKDQHTTEVLTNYASLWDNRRGAKLLLQWSDARIPKYQLAVLLVESRHDCAHASATLKNREKIAVTLVIQVPKPMYKDMADQQTLESFNRFRPPTLDVVGSQKVELHGVQADYFRHRDGACSLLIPIARQGIINLSVSSCTQSEVMFEAAKLLNVSRLNTKLTS